MSKPSNRTFVQLGLCFLASLLLGMVFTHGGLSTWDVEAHMRRSHWLVSSFGAFFSGGFPQFDPTLQSYGPLWELVLGSFTHIFFAYLRDPLWVRLSFNFALFPMTLVLVFFLLRNAGVTRWGALLSSMFLFGFIRLGGHALINTTDFPFSCAYLLVTLALWQELGRLKDQLFRSDKIPIKRLLLLGPLSMIPYLIRPPVIVHFLVLIGFLVFHSLFASREERKSKRIAVVLIPLVSGLLFMFFLWPTLWEKGLSGWEFWVKSFVGYASFPWSGEVRAFGRSFTSANIPPWYSLLWLPVNTQPLVFLGVILGFIFHFRFGKSSRNPVFFLDTQFVRLPISLRAWVGFFSLVGFLSIFVVKPVLYDEDRHLLFLFPPLLLFGSLSFERFSERIKASLTVTVFLCALVSYAEWGKYSYVYKSSLIGDRSASQFTGDYWAVCIGEATRALKDYAPPGSVVVVPGPFYVAIHQADRLHNSLLFSDPEFPRYDIQPYPPANLDYYQISYNREKGIERLLEAQRQGRAQVLWSTKMPPDDVSCAIARVLH